MEKLNIITAEMAEKNIEMLGQMFPNCLTEKKNDEGKIVKAIDFDKLRQELADSVVEGPEERYQFTWPGKRNAIRLANAPTTKTLRPCREESVDFDNTQNLYIEGDNLDVLKILRENYLGKVKVIYVDPPYNTGKDFVYNDDFRQNSVEYIAGSGQFDGDGNKLVINTESNGRFHTDWLNMIYPRLKVARDLLSDDGVIFISLDDNEIDNLKKVCNEIFGYSNFVGQLILKTATDNNPSQINIEHEYMLCYARNARVQNNWIRQSEAANRINQQYKSLKNTTSDLTKLQDLLRQWIKQNRNELQSVSHYNNVDEKGVYSSSSNSSNPHPGGYMFDILHPGTGQPCPKPQNGWRWPESTFWAYDREGEVEWGKDHTTQPHIKKRIETSVEFLRTLIYEDNRATTKMLADLFDGRKVFDNPKPMRVLARIIDFVTDESSIIIDFFSGSATTAHSVMQLNADDGGHRKFIMVQLPEETDEKSEAFKAGYKNICEIGKERIRRAGRKILTEVLSGRGCLDGTGYGVGIDNYEEYVKATGDRVLDIGFRVLKLDSANEKDVKRTPSDIPVEQGLFDAMLDDMVENIKEDRTPEDLLFQVLPMCNLPLSCKIETKEIDGKCVFIVEEGYLIACFDDEINENVITEIAKMKPYYFVMRDSSIATDNVADNFDQIFNAYSKDTIRRIL